MKLVSTLACLAVLAVLVGARPASAQTTTLAADLLKDWQAQKDTLMKIADAMPEAKFTFKPTDPQRNYGEQILHVATANVSLMKLLGSKVPEPTINAKATAKAEILKALADSFDYGTAALKEQTDATIVQSVQGPPFLGVATKAKIVYQVIGHTQDTYGQMAVYLRLNGIVPPASRGM